METLLFVYICGVTLVVGALWVRQEWVSRYKSSLLPPGPLPFPLLGNIPQLMMAGATRARARHRYLAGLANKYGPIFFLRLASTPVIVVSSPAVARTLLHTHDKTFATRPACPQARLLFGHDFGEKLLAFLPYNDEWKATRKVYIHHMFAPDRVQEFQSGIISHEIRRLLHTRLIPAATNAGHAIDLTACIGNLVSHILCYTIDSRRSESFSSSTTSCIQRIHELGDLVTTPLIGEFLPSLGFLDYKTKASLKKWYSWFDDFTEQIIAEREEKGGVISSKELVKDILDVFLLPENRLSRGLVKARIMELLGAGIETTSTAIDWGMSELLSNPRVIGQLREELRRVVGRREGDVVEVSHIPQLPYLRAVVKETFRMHPPAPLLIPHMSLHACEDVGGYRIPKGTMVLINLWAIGHDPNVWKDDPDIFMPERFLDDCSSMDVKGKHFEVIPFGSGRRICPGMNLALSIVEITLANLVHAFDDWQVVLPPGQHSLDMSDKCGLSCHRVHPLIVLPRKI